MDGVGNAMDGMLILGATNCPWELDNAIRRRFEKRVYIALPDPAARAGIFKIRVGKTANTLSDADWDLLGEASDGYSGSDIAVVVKDGVYMPFRRCTTAKKWKRNPDGFYTPTYPSDPAGEDKTMA